MVKNVPAMQQTQVQFLGREDLLQKEMATHSSILAWKIPWTEKLGRTESDMTEQLHFHLMVGGWNKGGTISFAPWDRVENSLYPLVKSENNKVLLG